MKNPDFTAPGIHAPKGSGVERDSQEVMRENRQAGPTSGSLDGLDKRPQHGQLESLLMQSQALERLRETRSALLVDLMEKVLPPWLRQRWIGMLVEIDFNNSETHEQIDRLCRECQAARGMLLRIMPGQGPENRDKADNQLIVLGNAFNQLANQWWIYTSLPR
ncbi:MAG: hypothetical protein R3179_05550 [Sedimenticolaceae bacterium]|nr:hypothetical protein [Sedimenticolaceae bacterium]